MAAIILCLVFAFHIIFILNNDGPYWAMCFPVPNAGPYLWPMLAIALALILFLRSRPGARILRGVLAALLLTFAADTLTGGDYRWFELAMRREMSRCGGIAALQAWAEQALNSPQQLASEDEQADFKTLPPEVQRFALATCKFRTPWYRTAAKGGPSFMFGNGGWDMGWGVIIGKRDLHAPSPVNVPAGRHVGWLKQLQPGVYLYVH
jgi:hypothetical protein